MARVVLYIATSLDGFIATPGGSVDWLPEVDRRGEDYGYAAFYRTIEALVMGRNTYEQTLSFGKWPYAGKPSYVFTRRKNPKQNDEVLFTRDRPDRAVRRIQDKGHRKIWLVGGGRLNASFLRLGLIDEWIISYVPVLLGGGIPLLNSPFPARTLKLAGIKRYANGLVQARYRTKGSR